MLRQSRQERTVILNLVRDAIDRRFPLMGFTLLFQAADGKLGLGNEIPLN